MMASWPTDNQLVRTWAFSCVKPVPNDHGQLIDDAGGEVALVFFMFRLKHLRRRPMFAALCRSRVRASCRPGETVTSGVNVLANERAATRMPVTIWCPARHVRSLIVALWSVPDLATYLVMKEFYGHLPSTGPLSLTDIATALAEAQGAVRDLSAQGLLARALELREQATTDGDERMMICAMSAIATAHRSAGNREEWLRWREAIQCRVTGRPFPRDIGHPHWDAQCALSAAPAYAAAPFADPRNWAAFVLISRG